MPTHPQYAALKALLADPATDAKTRDRIRINLDRWRWLPRDLGSKYVIVNVPGLHGRAGRERPDPQPPPRRRRSDQDSDSAALAR